MLDRRQRPHRTEPVVAPAARGEADQSLFDRNLPNVGRDLRLARERLGLSIEEVGAHLRIRAEYLAAIEAEQFERLPAPAYVTGFLRSYAGFVGLDPARVVAAYKTELAPRAGSAKLNFPTPLDEPRRPRGLVLVAVFLVALMVYGGWSLVRTRDRLALDYVPAPPARLTALVGTTPMIDAVPASRPPAPLPGEHLGGALAAAVDRHGIGAPVGAAEASLAAIAEARALMPDDVAGEKARPSSRQMMQAYLAPVTAGATPRPPALAAVADVAAFDLQRETAPEAAPQPRVAAGAIESDEEAARPANAVQAAMMPPPAPLQPPPVPAVAASESPPAPPVPPSGDAGYVPQTYGLANGDARVLLRARADSWVQIQGPNNELLLTRILRSGDTYRAPNRADIVMMTGNAGALEVIVDGRPLGPLGGEGQVRRNVPLVPDRLLALVTNPAN